LHLFGSIDNSLFLPRKIISGLQDFRLLKCLREPFCRSWHLRHKFNKKMPAGPSPVAMLPRCSCTEVISFYSCSSSCPSMDSPSEPPRKEATRRKRSSKATESIIFCRRSVSWSQTNQLLLDTTPHQNLPDEA